MMKKALLTFLLSTIGLLALEVGESIPKHIEKRLNLDDNKIYVLDFFASWCKSCKKELLLIKKVYEANATNIIAINVDKKKEDGKKLVAKLKLTFPVVYDEDKSLIEAFDPIGFPAIYYVKNNQILKVIFGAMDDIDEQIINDVKEMK